MALFTSDAGKSKLVWEYFLAVPQEPMTIKGKMSAPTFRVSSTASQAGEKSQSNAPNILSYPVF